MTEKTNRVTLCDDGKYRWIYEFDMYKNPLILFTIWKILAISFLIVFCFIALIISLENGWNTYSRETVMPFVWLFVVFFIISIFAYLIVAKQYGGKYLVVFEMDDKKIVHRQMSQQFEKSKATAWLASHIGSATNNATIMGLGLMNATRDSITSYYKDVKKIIPMRRFNTIKLNNVLKHNQIYVTKEDFDFVFSFLKKHCRNS